MTYTAFPFAIMLLSLGTIGVIVIRKFPQIALLDVENIPEVKEGKKKNEFLRKRTEDHVLRLKQKRSTQLAPFFDFLKRFQTAFRRYVSRIERRLVEEHRPSRQVSTPEDLQERQQHIRALLNEGHFAISASDYTTAEKSFISAIRLDSKNSDAYQGLADVYDRQGQREEAKQTYQFLFQLHPTDDRILVKLAELAEAQHELEEAVEYYQQAVLMNDHLSARFAKLAELLAELKQGETALEAMHQALDLEPQNPKYLDMMVEISIMVGNKESASKAFQALRMANPENQKLPIFKERIAKIDTTSL